MMGDQGMISVPFPFFPPLFLLLPLCSGMCVSNSCGSGVLRLGAPDMGFYFTIIFWLTYLIFILPVTFSHDPFFKLIWLSTPHTAGEPRYLFSFFPPINYSHEHSDDFWCGSFQGTFKWTLLEYNARLWKIAYWNFILAAEMHVERVYLF